MENRLLTFECVNCGSKAWSLKEIVKCSECGAVVVCTMPSTNAKAGEEGSHELQLSKN